MKTTDDMVSELAGTIRERIVEADRQRAQLVEIYERVTGETYKPETKTRKKFKRRKKAEMQLDAENMVKFIQSKEQGVTGAELTAKFGKYISFRHFIEKKTGTKIKTTGKAAGLRYFIA